MDFFTTIPTSSARPSFPYNMHFSSKAAFFEQSATRKESTRSVLVVDDVADIAFMLAAYLERAGYRVVPVFSSNEALEAVKREHFDAIISDIGLPVMDGYELAKELRKLRDYVSTPLIAVTGFAEYSDQQNAFNAGFDAHLKKPVDPTKLLEIVRLLGL
jgi:CheY-like chemotaxis protein